CGGASFLDEERSAASASIQTFSPATRVRTMTTPSANLGPRRLLPRSGLLLFSLCIFLAASSATRAGPTDADPPTPPGRDIISPPGIAAAPPSAQPIVAGAWQSFMHFLETNLNNRRRMLQFGVLGMCLALYIMIWRR